MQNVIRKFNHLLSSDKFFVFTVILLIIQAAWIALSAQYPLAFDENFHFGIIKLYAEQWGPFLAHMPDTGAYGALTRDPSYLYHYLVSFPYRLIALLTHNEVHQIITLRFLNIALFAAGLVAFRHLLLKLGITRRLTNFSLLMLIVVPVVPFLAAHINYDNLLFLLIPITISLAVTCGRALRQGGSLPVVPFLALVILSLLTTLVKYVFLPILLAIGLYLIIVFWRQPEKKRLLECFFQAFARLRPLIQIGLVVGLVISGSLFVERDVVNVIKYHNIAPPCSKVRSIDYCEQYGPWARNHFLTQQRKSRVIADPDPNPFSFGEEWAHDLLYRLYFAINYDYSTKPPLLVPYRVAFGVGLFGILFLCFWIRRILRRYKDLILPLAATVLYAAALFYTNYSDYLKYGERVAINGRYFIPLLPFIFVVIGLAYRNFFTLLLPSWRRYVKGALALTVLFMIMQGGGILTFIAESEPDWYWQDKTVVNVNQAAQRVVTSFIVGLH
jgi:hypothetical protein